MPAIGWHFYYGDLALIIRASFFTERPQLYPATGELGPFSFQQPTFQLGRDAILGEHTMKNCVTHHYACDCREEIFRNLLETAKEQHIAIDILFAMLIERDKNFLPSKSGKPWETIIKGNMVIAKADETIKADPKSPESR